MNVEILPPLKENEPRHKKDFMRVEADHNAVHQELSIKERSLILAAEAIKIAYMFNALAVDHPIGIGISLLCFAGASMGQAFVIDTKKQDLNEEEANNPFHPKAKTHILLAENTNARKQFAKSLIPGRGLAFLKLPKLGR